MIGILVVVVTALMAQAEPGEKGACPKPTIEKPAQDQPLTVEVFEQLHKALRLPEDERDAIPWKITLREAIKASRTEKKPVFVWAMHGHPLAAT